jgi:hypothetical protein
MRIKANSPPPDISVVDCLFYIGLTLQEKQSKDIGKKQVNYSWIGRCAPGKTSGQVRSWRLRLQGSQEEREILGTAN